MKPVESIDRVITMCTDVKKRISVNTTSKITFNNDRYTGVDCFILHEGVACVRGNDSKVVLAYISAPFILGYNGFFDLNGNVYVEAISEMSFEFIKAVDISKVLSTCQFEADMMNILMYNSFVLFRSVSILLEKDKNRLIEKAQAMFSDEPEIIRETMPFHVYISQKAGINPKTALRYIKSIRKSPTGR